MALILCLNNHVVGESILGCFGYYEWGGANGAASEWDGFVATERTAICWGKCGS